MSKNKKTKRYLFEELALYLKIKDDGSSEY
jgi:hypothetical protein